MATKTRRALAVAVAGLLACAGLVLVTVGSATAANLVTNFGFESGSTSGWTCDAGTSVVGTPVHSGTKYDLSAWVRGSYVYLGATGTGTTDVSTWTPGTSGYQELKTSFTTGASTSSVKIFVHGWYGQPTYYADDIALSGPGGPTTTTTTPTSTTTTTPPKRR